MLLVHDSKASTSRDGTPKISGLVRSPSGSRASSSPIVVGHATIREPKLWDWGGEWVYLAWARRLFAQTRS